MSKEFELLQAFTQQLEKTGMSGANVAACGYDYALLLFHTAEEQRVPRGEELPTSAKIGVMDRAAALLKQVAEQSVRDALERGRTGKEA